MNSNTSFFGIAIGIAAVFFCSTYTIFGKLLLENLHPETLIALTATLSVGLLLFFYGFLPELKEVYRLPKKTLFLLLFISFLSAVVAPVLILKGLHETLATNAMIIGRIEPVIVTIISILWIGEKFSRFQAIGTAFMILGVFYVVSHGFSLSFSLENKGDIFIVLGSIAGASATSIFKKYLHHVKPEIVVLMRNGVGGICMLILLPLLFDFSHSTENIMSTKILTLLFGFAFFTIIMGQILWYKALEKINASMLSSIAMLGPLFGISMAILILKEKLFEYHIIGFIVVIIGLCITLHHEKKNPHPDHEKHLRIRHFFHH